MPTAFLYALCVLIGGHDLVCHHRAFGAFYALVRRIGLARAGYIGVMTPVMALAVSSELEGFTWTGETVAGVALAIAGNLIAMWQPRRGLITV